MQPGTTAKTTRVKRDTGEKLLEVECTVGYARYQCVSLVDNGASHCFLLATVAQAAGLVLDTSQCLKLCMADGKLCDSQGPHAMCEFNLHLACCRCGIFGLYL